MSLRATPPLSAMIEQIQTELPLMMEQACVPGLGLALIRDGQIVWQAAFGVKQADTLEVLTTETIFQAASLSKPLFAYSVLRLVDQDILDLDRSLIEYLPATFVSTDPLLKQITARIVLCHLTGWPNWREDGQPLIRSTAPGARFSYSGEGFGYLQEVIEHITNQPLEQFMQQTVFVPLGMPRSTYAWTIPEVTVASSHDSLGKPSTPFRTPGSHAAASLQTTPFEYARFMCAMLASETIPHPLSAACQQEMLRPQVELEPAIAWGLGWGLQHTEDGWAFWHSGDNPGFKNLALAYPEARIGLVIMTNSDGGTKLWEPLLHLSLGGKYPLLAWREKSH
jgi:CubicO group peptidase (beta-lactamase class C family)